jgi:hypothetical protein
VLTKYDAKAAGYGYGYGYGDYAYQYGKSVDAPERGAALAHRTADR